MDRTELHVNVFGKEKEISLVFAQDGNFRSTIPNVKIGRDIAQVCLAKLLRVTISQDLTLNKHVENIVKKAGKRLYMLCQLKRAGIIQKYVVSVHVGVVRPVLEYACPVWHTNLHKYLSDNIEVIQKGQYNVLFLDWVTRRYLHVLTLNVRQDNIKKYILIKVKLSPA